MDSPNTLQTIFMVFYAIFWGVVANAQPKWRAFNWPVASQYVRTRRRLALSLVILNLVPIVYFVPIFLALHGIAIAQAFQAGVQVFLAIVAANAPFAVHRLYIAFLEFSPDRYYYENHTTDRPIGVEPIIDSTGRDGPALCRKWAGKNLWVALGHFSVCVLAALGLWLGGSCSLTLAVVIIVLFFGLVLLYATWGKTDD